MKFPQIPPSWTDTKRGKDQSESACTMGFSSPFCFGISYREREKRERREEGGEGILLLYKAADTLREPTLFAFLEVHPTRMAWQYG
jgi:hypothetical protein